MKKIAVVGVYGEGTDFTTGQAVKCYVLINWLKANYGSNEVVVVNTYKWKKKPIRLLLSLLVAFIQCKNIVIMPAQHGIKIFAPLVYYMNVVFHRRLHYIVIGGWLADMLKEKKSLLKKLEIFDGIHVEAKSMKKNLEQLGLDNIKYMPNCREFSNQVVRTKQFANPIKVCTYSRVVEEKGILDAIEICRLANKKLKDTTIILDIYGKVEHEFKVKFEKALSLNSSFVHYMGVKNASETSNVLQDYYVLLFPTYYLGEGFAGTVLDAFTSSIPIIANDWKYNSEIIEDGTNGFIYPYRDVEYAANQLVKLCKDEALYSRVCNECKKSAIRYSTDYVMKDFTNMLA